MTAAKFKPLIFSVSGFALSNGGNIFIFIWLRPYVTSRKIAGSVPDEAIAFFT
jgi:hypothetical protein